MIKIVTNLSGRTAVLSGGAAVLMVAAPCAALGAETLAESITGGKVSLDVRYRYEYVSQDNALKDAKASTVRSRLGYMTDVYRGVGAFLEFENVSVVGEEEYNSASNGRTSYALVSDPKGTELNQASLSYAGLPDTAIKYGRQRITLDNQRFIGNVGWRQNEQTFDAFSAVNKSLPSTTLSYAHLSNVNRVTGTDMGTSSDLFNVNYSGWAAGSLSAYAYLLDFAAAAQSTQTYGLRFSGGAPLGETKLLYTAEYANQSDYANNPASHDLNYMLGEIGGTLRGVTVKLGYEVLEGNGTQSVQTPLATLHAFNGWADQFLVTPADGLEDAYLSAGATLKGIDLLAVYHDYSANRGSGDYGTEWNFQALKKINKIYTVAVKYASYEAGDLAGKVDTDKFWVLAQASF